MTVDVTFDSAVFSLDVVKAACYRLIDQFTPSFDLINGKIICHLAFDAKCSEDLVQTALLNFRKEVLDQDLRGKLKIETESVRNLILAHAFSKTGLIADE